MYLPQKHGSCWCFFFHPSSPNKSRCLGWFSRIFDIESSITDVLHVSGGRNFQFWMKSWSTYLWSTYEFSCAESVHDKALVLNNWHIFLALSPHLIDILVIHIMANQCKIVAISCTSNRRRGSKFLSTFSASLDERYTPFFKPLPSSPPPPIPQIK